jgi:predicted lipoprotein with Yx(FWY)xxD motif
MSTISSVASLATSIRDSPVPAAISLLEDNGAFRFCDDEGRSIYVYDLDPPGGSVCTGQCAGKWPPIAAPQGATRIGDWMPIRRPDGILQWAYKGRPVYTFSGDTAAGQANGAGQGGVWRLLVP